jgi:hypothetical protein
MCQRQLDMLLTILKFLLNFKCKFEKSSIIVAKKSLFGLKSRKGKHEWKEYCIIARLFAKMLRTPMKT